MSNPEAVNDFVSSLNDLKTTNKANISMLTILAEDDEKFAPEITRVIENRLREAPSNEKLPVLYLIDSIIKNLPESQYKGLFTENIVRNFVDMFSQVDEKTRAAMFKVRQTWCDYFNRKKLFVLDFKVNKIDPKWPVAPLPPDGSGKPNQTAQVVGQPVVVSQAVKPPAMANLVPATSESIQAKEESLRKLEKLHQEKIKEKEKDDHGGDSAGPRDPRKRNQMEVTNEVVETNLESMNETMSNSPSSKKVGKRQLEPKDNTIPAVKSAKSEAEETTKAVESMDTSSADPTDAEFTAAVAEFKQQSGDQQRIAKKHNNNGASSTTAVPATLSASQPLEPVQPLKPPSTTVFLPPGPGPMPSLPPEFSTKEVTSEKELNRLLDEAERQLQSGNLSQLQYDGIVTRLKQLYEVQRKIENLRAVKKLEKLAPPSKPHQAQNNGSHQSSSKAPSTTSTLSTTTTTASAGGHEQRSGGLLPTPPAPAVGNAEPVKPLQPASFPSTAHVVLNGEPVDVVVGGPPRMVYVAGKRRALRINAQSRQVLMDGRPMYKLCSPLREIIIDSTRVMLFYHGEMQSLWINSVEYRVRVDAPPQTVTVDGHPVELVIDTGSGDIVVNGEQACSIANLPCDVVLPPAGNRYRFSYHAPARQIQIDGQYCEVKLDLPVPAVRINGELRGIRFDGPARVLLIDDEPFTVHTDTAVPVTLPGSDPNAPPLMVQLGAPAQELIIGDHRYNIGFDTGPVFLIVNNRKIKVELPGRTPDVSLLGLIDPSTGELLAPPPPPPIPPPVSVPQVMPMPPFGGPGGAPPFGNMPPPPIPPPMGPRTIGPPIPLQMPSQMAVSQVQHSGSYAQPTVAAMEPVAPPPPAPPTAPPARPPQVDINDLLSKLMRQGMLPLPGQQPTSTPILEPEQRETPDLSDFSMELFRTKYNSEITRLYAGVQCGSCGCRFSSPESARYRLHLDWHFRVNKRERDAVRVLRHRAWFLPVLEWIALEESADPDASLGINESSMLVNLPGDASVPGDGDHSADKVNRPNQLSADAGELDGEAEGAGSNGVSVVSCPAASDTKRDTCVVCGESFETFWNEELDEWHLKDAVCVAGKTYHTVCFEDAARANVASTPSSPTFTPSLVTAFGDNNKSNGDIKAEPEVTQVEQQQQS